jgi:tetratricopeptide (TPR) repeat protein
MPLELCASISTNTLADLITDFIERLTKAKDDQHALSVLSAEFALATRPQSVQKSLGTALDAAAVLHWFDERFLAQILDIPEDKAWECFEGLCALPFIESYRRGEDHLRNVHESTRLAWRKKLAHVQPEYFAHLSKKAALCFAGDISLGSKVEWIYHLLCGDPERGVTELQLLDRTWSNGLRPEDRYSMTAVLRELEDTQLVQGRARVWVLLVLAWAGVARGEVTQMREVATTILDLAQAVKDLSAESEAQCLVGDVFKSQEKLEAARAAYRKHLTITQLLAKQDPKNANLQRDLAVGRTKFGDVLLAEGWLEPALLAYKESVSIFWQLFHQHPSHAGWLWEFAVTQRRIADVLQAQGELEAALEAYEESLNVLRGLVNQDPSNASLQRLLAVTQRKVGDVREAQGELGPALAIYEESLEVFRRVVDQDPSFQQDLAFTQRKIDDVREAHENVEAALQGWRGE